MKVLGNDKLIKFYKKHTDSKSALIAWHSDASNAKWITPQDIKNRYRSADFLPNNRVIFNIKGNNYRLVVKVRYRNNIVFIEYVGTHADYDKQRF
ncbi:MAG: type II toxin-antitoxin system HigB family toxin [Gammaproteobacteria bacterium]|nr:type II toxin-antitoxin system HigB family toxin [Gammaproteobacteria bacterium]